MCLSFLFKMCGSVFCHLGGSVALASFFKFLASAGFFSAQKHIRISMERSLENETVYPTRIFSMDPLQVSKPSRSPPPFLLRQGQHCQRPRGSSAGLCCGFQGARCWFGCDHGNMAGASKLPTCFFSRHDGNSRAI